MAGGGWFGGVKPLNYCVLQQKRLARRLLAARFDASSRHAGRRISPNGRKSLASAVDEVDVRFVYNADLLHGFPQVVRLGEGLRTV